MGRYFLQMWMLSSGSNFVLNTFKLSSPEECWGFWHCESTMWLKVIGLENSPVWLWLGLLRSGSFWPQSEGETANAGRAAPGSKSTVFWRQLFSWVLRFNMNQTDSPCTGQAIKYKWGYYFCSGQLSWLPRTISPKDSPGLSPLSVLFSISYPFWPPLQTLLCSCSRLHVKCTGHQIELPQAWPLVRPRHNGCTPTGLLAQGCCRKHSQKFHQTRPSLSREQPVTKIL